MDIAKSRKNLSPNPPSAIAYPDPADAQRTQFQEANENGGLTPISALENHFASTAISSSSRKKILGERNDAVSSNFSESHINGTLRAKPVMGSQRIHWSGDRNGIGSDSPYDPVTNYTSPRPQFLRYNPNRRREILRRIEGELRNKDGLPASSSEWLGSSQATFEDREVQESNNNQIGCSPDDEIEDEEEEEEVEEERRCFSTILKSFLLLGVFLLLTCYISLMNTSSVPVLKGPRALNSSYTEPWALNSSYAKFQDWIFDVVSDPNVITGEEGTCYKWAVPVDLVKMERHLEHIGTHDHVLEVSDEHNGLERLKENEVNDEIQLAVKTEDDQILTINGSLADENSKEYKSSVDLIEKEQQSNVDGADGEEGTGADSVAEEDLLSYTKQESQDQLSSQGSSDESVTMSEEYTCDAETSVADFVSIMPLENKDNEEETYFSSTTEMNLVPEHGLTSLSKEIEPVLLILIPLSVFVLLVAWWKHDKSSPALLHPSEADGEDNILTKEQVEEKNNGSSKENLQPPSSSHDEQKGSSETQPQAQELLGEQRSLEITRRRGNIGSRSSSSCSERHEHDEFTGIRPPTVELLGEFSVVNTCFSGTGSGQKLDKEKDQGLPQAVTQHQRRKPARKNTSPSADYVNLRQSPQPLGPTVAKSNGNFSTPKKLPKKEDAGDEEAGKSVKTTTPLRRSSRLRNRITSP